MMYDDKNVCITDAYIFTWFTHFTEIKGSVNSFKQNNPVSGIQVKRKILPGVINMKSLKQHPK